MIAELSTNEGTGPVDLGPGGAHLQPPFVDLLGGPPRLSLNMAGVRQSLTFAYGGGGSQEHLARAIGEARTGATLFGADCFADDLFLGALIERVLWRGRGAARTSASSGLKGHLMAILSAPPYGPGAAEVVAFRQAISAELAESPELQGHAAAVVQRIEAFFDQLESGGVGMRLDSVRRGLDILAALKRVIDAAAHFGGAESGLRRIAEWSAATRASSAYQRLSDLLDYDGRLATVHVAVRLGRQGDVRRMDIVRVAENTDNPFHIPAWRRVLRSISFFLRGLRLRQDEVFARLVYDTFEGLMDVMAATLQLLAHLEFYRLGVSLAAFARERGLEVCLPRFAGPGRRLTALFNPFLLLEERVPIPCDIATVDAGAIVLITGPNSGGKTRLL